MKLSFKNLRLGISFKRINFDTFKKVRGYHENYQRRCSDNKKR